MRFSRTSRVERLHLLPTTCRLHTLRARLGGGRGDSGDVPACLLLCTACHCHTCLHTTCPLLPTQLVLVLVAAFSFSHPHLPVALHLHVHATYALPVTPPFPNSCTHLWLSKIFPHILKCFVLGSLGGWFGVFYQLPGMCLIPCRQEGPTSRHGHEKPPTAFLLSSLFLTTLALCIFLTTSPRCASSSSWFCSWQPLTPLFAFSQHHATTFLTSLLRLTRLPRLRAHHLRRFLYMH